MTEDRLANFSSGSSWELCYRSPSIRLIATITESCRSGSSKNRDGATFSPERKLNDDWWITWDQEPNIDQLPSPTPPNGLS
jgi:hypothetical protein